MADIISQKTGFLTSYQLLDALYQGDAEAAEDAAEALARWCGVILDVIDSPMFREMRDILLGIINSPDVSMRMYNTLREPMVNLLTGWLEHTAVNLYCTQTEQDVKDRLYKLLCIRSGISIKNPENLTRDNNQCINLLLNTDNSPDEALLESADIVVSPQYVVDFAYSCFLSDIINYDRLYLTGKLLCPAESMKDASIALCGSSYAMCGFDTDAMPRSTVNLAVNAQDPYYTVLSINKAREVYSNIRTVVIAGGYYFWHTDMTDNPSDYYLSIISRVNLPVFGDCHNYTGKTGAVLVRVRTDPLFEKLFDFEKLCEARGADIAAQLAALPYFNRLNLRNENGLLNYDFKEKPDDVNNAAAKARAGRHNTIYDISHLEANMEVFRTLLERLQAENINVILVFPPVTGFYSRHISPELRDSTLRSINSIRREYAFTLADLTESRAFDNSDFQDYDHLNEKGAKKLSEYVAKLLDK